MKKKVFFLMSRILPAFVLSLFSPAILSQTPANVRYVYTEASELTMLGQLLHNTPNPYHRVDTVRFKGFTPSENTQVRQSAGLVCAFRTNSTTISLRVVYGQASGGFSGGGFDLYIRNAEGQWTWAADGVGRASDPDYNLVLIRDMDGTEHDCLLYFPLFSEIRSLEVGVQEGAEISALPNPFRHRIAFFGSSFTHGVSTSRPAMNYPSQLSRATGLHILNLGCSGNCKLQPYFCDVLCAADADAFVFDAFSNPTIPEIEERLFPFIEKLQKAHPGKPLIFQRTIYRERRNFSVSAEQFEHSRQERAAELMKEAVRRYRDVYYIETTNATSPSHETSVDGTHPGDYGYTLWAESLRKPLLKILRKYGIK